MSYLTRTGTGRTNIAWGGGKSTKANYLRRTGTGRNNIAWYNVTTDVTLNTLERTGTGRNSIRWYNTAFTFIKKFIIFGSNNPMGFQSNNTAVSVSINEIQTNHGTVSPGTISGRLNGRVGDYIHAYNSSVSNSLFPKDISIYNKISMTMNLHSNKFGPSTSGFSRYIEFENKSNRDTLRIYLNGFKNYTNNAKTTYSVGTSIDSAAWSRIVSSGNIEAYLYNFMDSYNESGGEVTRQTFNYMSIYEIALTT